ncbi:MAG: sugar phosphate isomerase/epimerase [Pirellulaceae bacterium]
MQTLTTRRRFLALTTAAAAGATIFDVPDILAAEDPYRGLPIGVQSFSLRKYNVVEAIRHIQGMGLHFVEFYSKHLSPAATDKQLAENRQLLERAKVSISAHGVNRFSKDEAANRKVFEFAKRAGIRNITANPLPDAFDSLDKLVAEYNIRIAIHNHGPGALYDTIESVKKAVKGRHKLIGACVDTGHFIRSKGDPVKAVHELGSRVFGVHMKDEAKQEKQSHNVVIGSGHLDVLGLFRGLKKVGFPADGGLSLEYEANPDNPIDDMKQCLAVAREAIAKL